MKFFQIKSGLLMLAAVCILAACKKDDKPSGVIGFDAFKILAGNNKTVEADIDGVLSDNAISFKVKPTVDVTVLRPTFTLSNPETVVYVNKQPQENGTDSIDFSEPVKYDLKTRGANRSFTVTAIKMTAFTKFRFLKATNPALLSNEYKATIKGLFVEIKVPANTDVSNLIPTFEVTPGASVKVNGTDQQSGISKQNFADTVKYIITDADGTAEFKVKVNYLTTWQMIATQATLPEVVSSTSLKMAINPVTKLPYVVYQITGSKKIGVSTYNGSSWTQIDGGGISGGEGREPMLAFDKTGVLYVGYRDYDDVVAVNQQKLTVRKYANSVWSTVGDVRFSPTKADYESIGVDDNNVPWVSLAKATATADGSPYERRQLYTMKLQNNTWTVVDMPFKVLNSASKLVRAGGKLYMGIMDRTTNVQKLSYFELINNQWSAVGPTSFSADGKVGVVAITAAAGPDGSKYIAYQNSAGSNAKTDYVFKFNGSTWDIYASPIAVTSGSDVFSLAVHPDGTVYFVYQTASNLEVIGFNKQTNNWATPVKLQTGSVSSVDMGIGEGDGAIPYIVAGINSKMQVWKLDIPK